VCDHLQVIENCHSYYHKEHFSFSFYFFLFIFYDLPSFSFPVLEVIEKHFF
jgi:hypothetical protein